MNSQLRQLLLNEAIRIGDDLLEKAETTPWGMSWKSVEVQAEHVSWQASASIYNGVCGIVLFFIQLYKQTGQEKYKQAVLEGMRWVEWSGAANTDTRQCFLTGQMSVPFTCLQVYELTGEQAYLQKALQLTRASLQHQPMYLMEYINGNSGTLLCLLHLHAATGEAWLLEPINTYTGLLLDQIHIGKKGIYWDRSPVNIHGLCGFSHGASGIGWLLLELGNYFTNPSFYWLAEQAFDYESQYYDPRLNNWYDLRKILSFTQAEPAMRNAYERGEANYFTQGSGMNAWCHGAAGIGLVRLRAYELLGKPAYLEEARHAIEQTRATHIQASLRPSPTLCHGSAGNAELFLRAYEILYEPACLQLAVDAAQHILQNRQENGYYRSGTRYPGEDTSLFMGNAGVGYFFLRLLEPQKVPSILLPAVQKYSYPNVSDYAHLSISVGDIQQRILSKYFQRTLFLISNFRPHEKQQYFNNLSASSGTSFVKDFTQWVNVVKESLPASQHKVLAELWQLENKKLEMNTGIISDALWYYKSQAIARRAAILEAMPDKELVDIRLTLDPDIELMTLILPGSLQQPDTWLRALPQQIQPCYLLLTPSLDMTREQPLSDFTKTVLSVFREEVKVDQAIALVLLHLEGLSDQQIPEVWQLIMSQVRQAIRSGILLEPDKHPLPVIPRSIFAMT